MDKLKPTNKKTSDSFFYLLIIILIFLFNNKNIVYGANNNWVEVSKNPLGIQYIDKDSTNNKGKEIIEVSTKYLRLDPDTSKKIEENIYTMKINCLTHKFKDISVNGKKNLRAKWEEPNGDKLINDVISDSCKNV